VFLKRGYEFEKGHETGTEGGTAGYLQGMGKNRRSEFPE
jgi:hypothetical protein